jgi:hypothetical protein
VREKLLSIVQAGLIVAAWKFESPRAQLVVVVAMYCLMGWYAVHFIPAL